MAPKPVIAQSVAAADKPHRREDLVKQYREARRGDAMALFAEMDDKKRAELLAALEAEVVEHGPQLLRRSYSKDVLGTPFVRGFFSEWFAARTWGPGWGTPTAEKLLAFVAQ